MTENESYIIQSVKIIKGSSRCKVTLGTGDFFECSSDIVLKFKLGIGEKIDSAKIKIIKKEQNIIEAKQTAYNFASYKPRTIYQVKINLKDKGFEDDEIEPAISFLENFGLLNDTEYAEKFIKDLMKFKPAGKPKVIFELTKRGISKVIAEEVADKFFEEDDRLELAERALAKKLRTNAYKPTEKQKNAAISYLQSQGFEWDVIKGLIKKYFEEGTE